MIIVDNQLSDSERIISSTDYLSQFQRSPSRNAGNVKYLRLIVAMLDQSQAYERFLISLRKYFFYQSKYFLVKYLYRKTNIGSPLSPPPTLVV